MVCRPTLWYVNTVAQALSREITLCMGDNSMDVRQHRVCWSRLWMVTVTAVVACSKPYRQEPADETHDQPGIYNAQYTGYSTPLHNTNSDAVFTQHMYKTTVMLYPQHHVITTTTSRNTTIILTKTKPRQLQLFALSNWSSSGINATTYLLSCVKLPNK